MQSVVKSLLIDKFTLFGDFLSKWYYKDVIFPHIIERDADKVKCDPIFESFKRLCYFDLRYNNIDQTVKALTDSTDLDLEIKLLSLNVKNSEVIETITNPKFFTKRLESLEFLLNDTNILSDIFFININTINPKKLSFRLNYMVKDEFDHIRIFNNIYNIELKTDVLIIIKRGHFNLHKDLFYNITWSKHTINLPQYSFINELKFEW